MVPTNFSESVYSPTNASATAYVTLRYWSPPAPLITPCVKVPSLGLYTVCEAIAVDRIANVLLLSDFGSLRSSISPSAAVKFFTAVNTLCLSSIVFWWYSAFWATALPFWAKCAINCKPALLLGLISNLISVFLAYWS